MDANDSISMSQRLRFIQSGDNAAMDALWDRYHADLVRFAGKQLVGTGVHQGMENGEDVAQSAMKSLFLAIQKNRLQDVRDEQGLLRFLFKITVWKVIDRKRKQEADKAGGGLVVGESALGNSPESIALGIGGLRDPRIGPESIVIMREQFERLLAALDDDELRKMACFRFEGHSNAEIAKLCGCSLATVERRFNLIREIWTDFVEREDE